MMKSARRSGGEGREKTSGTSRSATGGKGDDRASRRNFLKGLCCWTSRGSDEVGELYEAPLNASTEDMFDIEVLSSEAVADITSPLYVEAQVSIPTGECVAEVKEEIIETILPNSENDVTVLVPCTYDRGCSLKILHSETANLQSFCEAANLCNLFTNDWGNLHLTAVTRWLQDVTLHITIPKDTCFGEVQESKKNPGVKRFPTKASKKAIVPFTCERNRRVERLHSEYANLQTAYVSIDLWKFCNHVWHNLHLYCISVIQGRNKVAIFLYNTSNEQKIWLSMSQQAFQFLKSVYQWVRCGQPWRNGVKKTWPMTKKASATDLQSCLSFSYEYAQQVYTFLLASEAFHLQIQNSRFIPMKRDICLDIYLHEDQQLATPMLQLAPMQSLQGVHACGWFSQVSPLKPKSKYLMKRTLPSSQFSAFSNMMLLLGKENRIVECLNVPVPDVKIDAGRIKVQKDLATFLLNNQTENVQITADKTSSGALEFRVAKELKEGARSVPEKEICYKAREESRKTKLGFCMKDAAVAEIDDTGKPAFLATDESSFDVFRHEYQKIVKEWHSAFDGNPINVGDTKETIKAVKVTTYDRLNSWWAVQSSVSLFRSIRTFPFWPFMQSEDRKTVGYIMESIADSLECHYIKLSTDKQDEKDLLRNFSVHLRKPLSVRPEEWPGERAVLVVKEFTKSKQLIVKVNFEEHLEICCIANEGAMKKAMVEALKMEQLIQEKLNDMDFDFSRHDVFGYCNSNLLHIGMASVMKMQLYIPELYQHGIFNDLLKHHHLRMSYFGRKKGRSFKIVELESTVQFGASEIDILNAMYNVAFQFIEMERHLEHRKDIRFLLPESLKLIYDDIKAAETNDQADDTNREHTREKRGKGDDTVVSKSREKRGAGQGMRRRPKAGVQLLHQEKDQCRNKNGGGSNVQGAICADQEPFAVYQQKGERLLLRNSTEARNGNRVGRNGDFSGANGNRFVVDRANSTPPRGTDFLRNYSGHLRRARPNNYYSHGYQSQRRHRHEFGENRHGSDAGEFRSHARYRNYAQGSPECSDVEREYHLQTASNNHGYFQDGVHDGFHARQT